ncbi:hypothetical protein ABNF97_09505 [Plantactinospora sp. B6F1]|uniref:hypothetical protein n=1 Tax=Plantactinospora sp. B6F1 TaxID=3158971 RepID=UPI0032D8CABE
MVVYHWVDSRTYCDASEHGDQDICGSCEDETVCADCGDVIAAGVSYLFCVENGEGVHADCSPDAASADWVDYY